MNANRHQNEVTRMVTLPEEENALREGRHSAVHMKKVTNMVTLPGEGTDVSGRDGILPSTMNKVTDTLTLPRQQAVGHVKPRKHPARGVQISISEPTIVFVTVCAKDRNPWLSRLEVHKALVDVWATADAWGIGYYLLMPDHMHFFCSPAGLDCSLQRWITHWKRKFSSLHVAGAGEWQRDFWDTRLRRGESYSEKWEYVRHNPVRKGLVERPDDWPYQGVLNELRW